MLIIFKSAASGDVIMFGKNGKQMLEIIGKDQSDAKGIVTVEQLPEAIARLKKAVQEDKQRLAEQDGEDTDVDPRTGVQLISLAQRAIPLVELMEYSLRDKVPVTWGV